MKTSNIFYALLMGMLITSCKPTDYTQEAADIPVIEAFLVPGKVPEVTITRIIPYAADEADSIAVPLAGLDVNLKIKGSDYILREDTAGSGKYRYPADSMLIHPGDTIVLHTLYHGAVIESSTVVPSAPASLKMSTDILYYTSGNPSSWLSAGEIDLTWENSAADFYYITVENVETSPVALNTMAENMPKFGISPPSKGNQFRIGMRNVTYYGTHRVIVYHVNPEFAELFDNPGMSTVAMTEPPTNIKNGLGIFTAVYPDTLYFEVKKLN
jgi:hypothetical protein